VYQICGNWFHYLPACSCSHLLCTSRSCSGGPVHQVWWDVGDILQPWRPYFSRQRPCPGAAPSAWESQELHVLLLSLYSLLLRHLAFACAVALLLVDGRVWTLVAMSGGSKRSWMMPMNLWTCCGTWCLPLKDLEPGSRMLSVRFFKHRCSYVGWLVAALGALPALRKTWNLVGCR
jgi:hypothetical protein